jgi:hypothetical protein
MQPAVFEACRRRQSYFRHGGHGILFGKLQFIANGSDEMPFLQSDYYYLTDNY